MKDKLVKSHSNQNLEDNKVIYMGLYKNPNKDIKDIELEAKVNKWCDKLEPTFEKIEHIINHIVDKALILLEGDENKEQYYNSKKVVPLHR